MTSEISHKKLSELLPRGLNMVTTVNGAVQETVKIPYLLPDIVQVIFEEQKGVTVLLWADGDKTVVHCGEGETFDRYTGFMACVCKKMFGGTTTAKKLMNTLDKKYQAKLKAEKEAKEKEKRDAEAAAAKAKADKLRKKKNEEAMEELVKLFLMNTEAQQRAKEILRGKNIPFEDVKDHE